MSFSNGKQSYRNLLTKSNFECATVIYMCMKIILWWVDLLIFLRNSERLISQYPDMALILPGTSRFWSRQELKKPNIHHIWSIYIWWETVIYSMFMAVHFYCLIYCISLNVNLKRLQFTKLISPMQSKQLRWYLLLCCYCAFVAAWFFLFWSE